MEITDNVDLRIWETRPDVARILKSEEFAAWLEKRILSEIHNSVQRAKKFNNSKTQVDIMYSDSLIVTCACCGNNIVVRNGNKKKFAPLTLKY